MEVEVEGDCGQMTGDILGLAAPLDGLRVLVGGEEPYQEIIKISETF